MFPATLTRDHGHVRRVLIVALTALMVCATLAIAPFAQAVETVNTSPDGFRPHSPENNQVSAWCSADQGITIATNETPYRVPTPPADAEWTLLVIKAAAGDRANAFWNDPIPGALYQHPDGHATSHVILCWEETEPEPATLTLVKTVEGGTLTADDFPVFIDGDAAEWGKTYTLDPGDYVASETQQTGYTTTGWGGACDPEGNVTLAAGDDLTCTITNTYEEQPLPGYLTLRKVVYGEAEPSAWTLTATRGDTIVSGSGPEVGPIEVPAGTYALSESADFEGSDDYSPGPEGWSCVLDQVELSEQTTDVAFNDTVTVGEGESWTCTITNTYDVPYPTPKIDIEKATNGIDADNPTGPQLLVGSTVTWTYVVTNTGNVDLTDVTVTDDILGDICEIGDLAVGASETCTATGTAVAGQYANEGKAVGYYQRNKVKDTDPSHYYGYLPPINPDEPKIDIEKATNGIDADAPGTGPVLQVGSPVTWTYVVTNTGNVDLTDVAVTDDILGEICEIGDLAVGASATCTATGSAELVNYANVGTAVGSFGTTKVTDKDPSHYSGVEAAGTTQLGDTVWLDANKNGIQDAGEAGYNGVRVILTDSDGNAVGTLTTATGPWVGFYKFVGLDAGTYTATLDLSSVSGYQVTTKTSFTITLADGEEYLDADFGLFKEEELPKTGFESGELGFIALGLLLFGTLAVLAANKWGFADEQ